VGYVLSMRQRSVVLVERTSPAARAPRLPAWWPLAALTLLAAALRFSTLDLQSFWYDEAFTPVHVLHAGLVSTLRAVAHHENTPPLWYLLVWAWSKAFGTGMVALRLPSALAGVATVPVAWEIGRELAGRSAAARRAAIVTAGLVAVNPLFVWYSQEARAYALFVLLTAVAMLCCLRADRKPTRGRLAAFAVSASLALLTHYFAVFLLIPMAAWLLRRRSRLRVTLPAIALIAAVGIAELPLISAQGGHGTQWISAWALGSRVAAIPQYYLTGYSGASLGHSIELLVALALLAGIGLGLRRGLTRPERTGALLALGLAACGVLVPLLLAILGADYLAPRNVIAAMIPATAAVAVITAAKHTGRAGLAAAAVIALAFTALSIDVNLSPRLQRADWRAVAHVLAHELGTTRSRAITTIELGSAPLEYYLPPLHNLFAHQTVRVSEIDETGYPPLRPGAGVSPAPGFRLRASYDIHGLILYRFTSAVPRVVSQATLLRHVITAAPRQVLVPGSGVTASAAP
jgi:4-amino-4-deoxy-L-arabinose transferase-like glycosyltransferase